VYFTIALLTPSPAYDSSTNLILLPQDAHEIFSNLLDKLSERLMRWDAIYFVRAAERGISGSKSEHLGGGGRG